MDDLGNILPLGASTPVGELLLAEIAIRIELPPSLHQLAVERFHAARKHIEREGSPLENLVVWFYPQGSMAIRATIKSRKRSEGFDIDIVAELSLPPVTAPARVLDLLFEALNGPPGSMYHGMVKRQTRCVTVYYADGMHLDITPSELLDEFDPRRSNIFHAKPGEPSTAHLRLVMNSWGFCDWFNNRTPADLQFEQAYASRASALDRRNMLADADVKPVPAHSTVDGGKSTAVVALQLLKRNRNIRYAARKGRVPPSVMIAKFAAEEPVPGTSIAGALNAISMAILSALERAEAGGTLADVRNPRCQEDRFTDRWPEDRASQRVYIQDLKLFRRQLDALMSDRFSLEQKRDLLIAMFGESPARSVVEDYAARLGRAVEDGTRRIAPSGRVLGGAAVPAPAVVRPAAAEVRPHTFFGSTWRRR